MGKENKLKPLDYAIIIIIFAITGSTAAIFPKFLMPIFPVEKGTVAYVALYILLITPIYQVLLLAYAFIFGKFSYFWEKQKKIGLWIGRKLGLIKSN
ncbi:MAG: hypothetical protein MRZ79_14905 [Bacteroidia bacterium]|nr:hypothetical protein [Bacteroidia bacterium]